MMYVGMGKNSRMVDAEKLSMGLERFKLIT
jgi:hypothetical protein